MKTPLTALFLSWTYSLLVQSSNGFVMSKPTRTPEVERVGMVKNRGLEIPEEGATPLRECTAALKRK